MATDTNDPISAIQGITSLVGLGFKVAGTTDSIGIAKQEAGIGLQEAALGQQQGAIGVQEAQAGAAYSVAQTGTEYQKIYGEESLDNLRRSGMELAARRMSIENVRNAQSARAQATIASVASGSQYGSGYKQQQGQIASEEAINATNINQQLMLGRGSFDVNAMLNQTKVTQAQQALGYGTQMAGYKTQLSQIQGQYAGLQGQSALLKGQQATASGLSSMGGDLMSAAGSIGKLATLFI